MVKRILVAVVLAPLFFVVLFFLDPVWLAALMAAICALASFELLRATGVAHHNGLYCFTALSAAADAAAGFVAQAIQNTPAAADERYGVWFEPLLPRLSPMPET